MAGIKDGVFDGLAYCTAKRAAEKIVLDSPVPTTIVKSTLWHECATNPAAVVFNDREVVAEAWLIQPIAADTVADVLVGRHWVSCACLESSPVHNPSVRPI